MNTQTFLLALLVVVLALLLVACSSSTLITSLQLVEDAVTVAIPVLQAAGVDPAALAQAQTYLTAVETATTQATTELASTDTAAVKAAKIASYFAAAVAPDIGNAQVAAVVRAVAAAVQSFLALLNPGQAAAVAHLNQGQTTVASAPQSAKLSLGDRRKLGQIRSSAEKHLAQLAVLKR